MIRLAHLIALLGRRDRIRWEASTAVPAEVGRDARMRLKVAMVGELNDQQIRDEFAAILAAPDPFTSRTDGGGQ